MKSIEYGRGQSKNDRNNFLERPPYIVTQYANASYNNHNSLFFGSIFSDKQCAENNCMDYVWPTPDFRFRRMECTA